MRAPQATALLLLSALPTPAPARPGPYGFSLETAVPVAAAGAAPRLTAVTSWWLNGGLEGEARLAFGSVGRPPARGADAMTPALGLRWGRDLGRWRPRIGVEVGVRLPAAGRSATPTGAARAGVELFGRRDLALSVGAGWRWTSGAAPGLEAVVGLGYYP
jgi:hypothetical protein